MQRTERDQLTTPGSGSDRATIQPRPHRPAGKKLAIAAFLGTARGRVFLKGLRTKDPRVACQYREAAISPYILALSPQPLWQAKVDGWNLLGFQAAPGWHADDSPGSADLPKVVDAERQASVEIQLQAGAVGAGRPPADGVPLPVNLGQRLLLLGGRPLPAQLPDRVRPSPGQAAGGQPGLRVLVHGHGEREHPLERSGERRTVVLPGKRYEDGKPRLRLLPGPNRPGPGRRLPQLSPRRVRSQLDQPAIWFPAPRPRPGQRWPPHAVVRL